MIPAPPTIAFDDVSKTFGHGRVTALDRVSLDVPDRQFLAIVGPSGSGKSTLLRLVNRLADPDRGAVRVDGEDVRAADPIALRRRIGYVFQGVGLFPHMTVTENVAITPRLAGWDERRISARVADLLDLVRLDRSAYAARYPHELSGGERQRVGVARALAAGPRIVLMDEPFGALDPVTREAIGADYRRLHDELGLTTIMITHDALEAVLLADRIAAMVGGRIAGSGTPRDMLGNRLEGPARELMDTPRRQAERLGAIMSPELPG